MAKITLDSKGNIVKRYSVNGIKLDKSAFNLIANYLQDVNPNNSDEVNSALKDNQIAKDELEKLLNCTSSKGKQTCSKLLPKKFKAIQSILKEHGFKIKPTKDQKKLLGFLSNNGAILLDYYRNRSGLYPLACSVMSAAVALLLKEEGIPVKIAKGNYDGSLHYFNIIELDGEEYILDFTANQFTHKMKVVKKGLWSSTEIDPSVKGKDIIPHLIKLSDAKHYYIETLITSDEIHKNMGSDLVSQAGIIL